MPIEVKIKEDGAFIHVKARGKIVNEDVIGVLKTLESDDRVKPDHVTLYDCGVPSG